MRDVLTPSDADLGPKVIASIDDPGRLSTALLAGLDGGFDAVLCEVARLAASDDPNEVAPALTAFLVAENEAGGIVGGVLTMPPIAQLSLWMQHGIGFQQGLVSAITIVKLVAVAVDQSARGLGIGTALLQRATQMHMQAGAYLLYGQFRADSGLHAYYVQRGFEVLQPDEGIDVEVLTNLPAIILPEPGDRLFGRWR